MQQLTDKQIDILFEYTESFNVPFKDVQCEIVDHLASALETCYPEDDSISFGQKLFNYTKTLPHNFFFDLVESKKKSLEKAWWQKFLKAFKNSFSLPVLLLWIIASTLFYIIFQNDYKLIAAIFGFSYFWIVPSFVLYKANYQLKNNEEGKFLFLNMYADTCNKLVVFLGIIPLGIINFINNQIALPDLALTLFFAYLTVVYYLIAFPLPKILSQEVEHQYAHLNIKLT